MKECMARVLQGTLVLAVLCMVTSCSIFNRKSLLDSELEKRNAQEIARLAEDQNSRQLREEAYARFKEIRELIGNKRFLEAERKLAEMDKMVEYAGELNELRELLNQSKRLVLEQTDLAIDKKTIINEAETRLYLPETYNKIQEINLDDVNDGPNSLEQLMDKHVSMKVSNQSLGEFAMQLQSLEGISIADPVNVIFSDEVLKGQTFSANFKDVPLREIFDFISYNLSIDFNIHGNIIWATKASKPVEGPRLVNKIIQLRQGIIPTVPEGIGVAAAAKAAFETTKEEDTDLDNALKAFYAKSTTGGSYTLFPQRNALLVTDTLANIREVEKLVKVFCKPPFQVVIEAKFMLVSEADLHDVGVELSHYNGGKKGKNIDADNQTNANISDFVTKLGTLTTDNPEGVGSMVLSGILGNRSFDMVISALEKKSSTVTLSVPRVTALNNRTARIRKGDRLLYFEEYSIQSINRGDSGTERLLVPTGKPTSTALGITFDVKPSVGADGKTVLLGLKPEIVSFLQWEDFSSTSSTTANNVTTTKDVQVRLPRVHEETLATSVAINSGETVILGGMVENRETVEVRKIPLLGDIPYIGSIFRHTKTSREPANLLIFVTATIINENGEYVIVNR